MGVKLPGKDDELKTEIGMLFKKLCYNLDVLSNFNFTPKPTTDSAKINTNVPSIRLEEKTPIFVSDRQTKAPQELFKSSEAKFKVQTVYIQYSELL